MKRVTIKDLSVETNLSLATISNILRGNTMYAAHTRKLVWDTAHRLGYTPNKQAQDLRRKASPEKKFLNHLIMRINYQPHVIKDDNIFEALRSQLFENEVLKRGYFPTVYLYHAQEGFRCPLLIDKLIDGVVLGVPHPEIIEMFRNRLPVVLMDIPSNPHTSDIPRVNMNIRNGFMTMLDRAIALGHRKIAFFNSKQKSQYISNDIAFFDSCISILNFYGIGILPHHLINVEISPETHWGVMRTAAQNLAQQIKRREISLLICANSVYADALYKLLPEFGISVPQDVSLLSVDFKIYPTNQDISSISYDWQKMIQTSLDVLMGLIEEKSTIHLGEFLVEPQINIGKTLEKTSDDILKSF